MSIYSITELSNSKIAVACYEDIFIWDLLSQEQLCKFMNSDESIKKVITLLPKQPQFSSSMLESDVFCSVDNGGIMHIYDGKNILY